MNILGINANTNDRNGQCWESSAAILIDGKIIAAVSEERISRIKLDGSYPSAAIEEVLSLSGLKPGDIDIVAFASVGKYKNVWSYGLAAWKTFLDTKTFPFPTKKVRSVLNGLFSREINVSKKPQSPEKYQEGVFPNAKRRNVDHHYAHAAGAYYASPFDEALVITLDGGGNGLDGGAYVGVGSTLNRFISIPHFQSPGTMYSAITHDLGYRRHRHEGKITGLAAYGSPSVERLGLADLIRYDREKERFISKHIARHHKDLDTHSEYFFPLIEKFGREDVCATVQKIFEDVILEFIKDAIQKSVDMGHSTRNVCLAGGCFANVRMNQRIIEIDNVDNIFVFPAMGDGGLSAGAALVEHFKSEKTSPVVSASVRNVFLGRSYSDSQIKEALEKANLKYTYFKHIEVEIANQLATNKVVCRFNGRMEYGPRALGNRSILANPFDTDINIWLNEKLKRTEFMPFAPSLPIEYAQDYLVDYDAQHAAADFMTLTYDVNPEVRSKIPAVVHVDGTARPQIVRSESNPSFHKIIVEFNKLTTVPVLLNTSFNVHEEPIVMSPQDAINGFLKANIDCLAIGSYMVHQN